MTAEIATLQEARDSEKKKPVPRLNDPKSNQQIRARIQTLAGLGMPLNRITVDNLGVGIETPAAAILRWLNGEHLPDIGGGVSVWLDGLQEVSSGASAERFGFVITPTVQSIVDTLDAAREQQGSELERGIGAIFGASGSSKTSAVKWYVQQENKSLGFDKGKVAVYHLVDGDSSTWVNLLRAILRELDGHGYAQRVDPLVKEIAERMYVGGIIILDEAQLLPQKLLMQLRTFCDTQGIAIALVGNARGYKSLNDANLQSLLSRMGSDAVFINLPSEEDVNAILEAWRLGGRGMREFLFLIAHRDGGLRYLANTVREANRLAMALGREIDLSLLQEAAKAKGAWARSIIP